MPLPDFDGSSKPLISVRDINRADRAVFKDIERNTTPQTVLSIKGSGDTQYFLSGWQRIYSRFTRYSRWIKAVVASEETIGFISVAFQDRQQKGLLIKPIVKEDYLDLLPATLYEVGTWLEQAERKSIRVEIPDQWITALDYLLENEWKRQFTWLELVRWLK